MTLFGYDENGELAFRQGPFTFDHEAIEMFEKEKADMRHNKIFHLSLEKTYLEQSHRMRVYLSEAR
jgi:hypothetical protein